MSLSHKQLFGQEAVEHVLRQHNGKATPKEIREDILQLIKAGIVADSVEETLSRALGAMVRAYKLRKLTDKYGHVLAYELA